MPYYRHNSEKILYRLPDNPAVKEETHKRQFAGWKIAASLEIIYAENPIDPETGRLTYPENRAAITSLEPADISVIVPDERSRDRLQAEIESESFHEAWAWTVVLGDEAWALNEGNPWRVVTMTNAKV